MACSAPTMHPRFGTAAALAVRRQGLKNAMGAAIRDLCRADLGRLLLHNVDVGHCTECLNDLDDEARDSANRAGRE
jgi:hypothetical protein